MKIITFGFGLLASMAIAAPAFAFERDGTTHFDSRLGSGTATFSQSYDPNSGAFSRTGKIALENGRTLTYSLSGTCDPARQTCDFTGTATGPFGGKWRADGSVKREANGSTVDFRVTDGNNAVPVTYTGLLPDLFREGQGVVAEGALAKNGVFHADSVLDKHDERYMPPEVAEALKRSGHWQGEHPPGQEAKQ